MNRMNMNRREFLRVAGLSVAGAALAGCVTKPTPTAPPDEPTAPPVPEGGKLTVWCAGATPTDFLNARAREFVVDYPGYEIEAIDMPEINDKVIATLVAGTGAPDLCNLGEGFITAIFKGDVASQTLYDLNPLMAAEDPTLRDKFLKWGYYTDQNGKTYGAEMALSQTVHYYRKDLYDQAGVDPNELVTYDDFILGGKKFHATHPDKYAIFLDIGGKDHFAPFLLQNGGGYFDADGNVILDCAENVEALQLVYDMVYVHEVAWGNNDCWGPGMWAALKDGTAAGNFGAGWYNSAILQAQVPDQAGSWSAAPQPVFQPGAGRTGCLGGIGVCIPKQTEYPEVAWDFLVYSMLTKESQVKKYLEIGMFPTMLDAFDDPRITDVEDDFLGGLKFGGLLASVAPDMPKFVAFPFLAEAYDLARQVVPMVMTGEKTADVALQDAAQELKDLIAQG